MRLFTTLCGVALFSLAAAAYAADPVTITFTPSSITRFPVGPDFTFAGTIKNNTSSPIFLSGDMLDLNPNVPGISIDDTPLFLAAPAFGSPFLAPNASFTGDLLTVSLDNTVPYGSYIGTLTLVGGFGRAGNPNDTNFLGQQTFQINAVPEPSVVPMVAAAGIAGSVFLLRRRRVRSK